MALKDIGSATDAEYMMLSQTPGEYSPKNYYDKELQQTIDRNWEVRPNRATVEYESSWGKNAYSEVEVVIQTVKSDTGTTISDDYRRLVFRDIRDSRFLIGTKFRFSPEYDLSADEADKDIWLTMNRNTVSLTSSAVVVRCNNTLGSMHKDSQGIATAHYEPGIFGLDMRYVNNEYSQTAVTNQSTTVVYVQSNEYTKEYFINERFVVGTKQIFRIKGIDDFYAHTTKNPQDVGIIKLYLEKAVSSEKDDFETRIAYQQVQDAEQTTTGTTGDLSIRFELPETMPTAITSEAVEFEAHLYKNGAQQALAVTPTISLENLPAGVDASVFATLAILGDNTFSIVRNDVYQLGNLILTVTVPAAEAASSADVVATVSFDVRTPE